MTTEKKQNNQASSVGEEEVERPPVSPEELEEMLRQLADAKAAALSRTGVEVVQPPHKIKDKVSVSASGVSPEMLDRAEKVMTSMAGDYLTWAGEDLQRLQDLYERLERTPPAEAKPVLRELFSLAHDMKGQGGSFGYGLVTVIGNMLCRLIEKLENDWRSSYLAVIKVHVDALRLVISGRMQGDGGRAGENMISGLEATLTKTLKGG